MEKKRTINNKLEELYKVPPVEEFSKILSEIKECLIAENNDLGDNIESIKCTRKCNEVLISEIDLYLNKYGGKNEI